MTESRSAGRVVWITGAAGGLGRALAAAFATAGWGVAAAGHAAAPEDLGRDHPSIWPCRMDVTRAAEVDAVAGGIRERWGRLDVLINNAGVNANRLLVQTDDDTWNRVLGVNLKGAFLTAKAAVPLLAETAGGMILNVASQAARGGPIGQAAYAAAKAGLVGLTLSLARELAEQGIRVNAVLPGVLPTPMLQPLSPSARDQLANSSVLRRINRLEPIARFFVALAEDTEASGQIFALDGRITRWT